MACSMHILGKICYQKPDFGDSDESFGRKVAKTRGKNVYYSKTATNHCCYVRRNLKNSNCCIFSIFRAGHNEHYG